MIVLVEEPRITNLPGLCHPGELAFPIERGAGNGGFLPNGPAKRAVLVYRSRVGARTGRYERGSPYDRCWPFHDPRPDLWKHHAVTSRSFFPSKATKSWVFVEAKPTGPLEAKLSNEPHARGARPKLTEDRTTGTDQVPHRVRGSEKTDRRALV